MHNVSGDIGEAEIAPAVAVGEPGMVDAHQVKDGRVQVVNMDRLVHSFEAEIVGRAMNVTAFDAAPGEHAGKNRGCCGPARSGLSPDR